MELLFATIGGALLGTIFRYVIRGRSTHGELLLPAVGKAVAAIVWSGLTWIGWSFDGGWIWVVTLIASVLVTLALAIWLPSRRRTADAELLATLSRPARPIPV